MKTTTRTVDQKTEPSMEDILSSIREIISGEADDHTNTHSDERPGVGVSVESDEVLDLTHMLREDDTIMVVPPFEQHTPTNTSSSQHSESFSTSDESLVSLDQSSVSSKALPDSGPSKKRIPPSEEAALEDIAKTLSEMDQDHDDGPEPLHGGNVHNLHREISNISEDIHQTITRDENIDDLLSEDALSEAADALDALTGISAATSNPVPLNEIGEKSVESLMRELLRPLLKDWLDANLPSIVRTIVTEQVQKIVQQKSQLRKAS